MNTLLVLISFCLIGITISLWVQRFTKSKPSLSLVILISIFGIIIVNPLYLVLLTLLGISWTGSSIIPLFICCFISLVILKNELSTNIYSLKSVNLTQFQLRQCIPPLIILITIFLVYLVQVRHSFIHADAVGIWFSKAVIMFKDQGILLTSFNNPEWQSTLSTGQSFSIVRPSYPLLVPLNIAFIFILLGATTIATAKILWLLITAGLLISLYYVLVREYTHPIFISLALLGFIFLPGFLQFFNTHLFGFADPWLMFFFTLGLLLVLYPSKNPRLSVAALAIVSSAAVMTKIEGLLSLLFFIPLLLSSGKTTSRKIIAVGISIPIILAIVWYEITLNQTNSTDYANSLLTSGLKHEFFIRVPPLLITVIKNLGDPRSHHLIWLAYVVALCWTVLRQFSKVMVLLFLFPILAIVFYSYTYAASPHDQTAFLTGSIHRYAAQWLLYSYILILLTLKAVCKKA